jgi:hypothetical protein
LKVQFDVPVGHSILGVVLAFLFSFVGVHGTGTLAINPVGPIAKCSQVIFGGISKAQGQSVKAAQMSNLIAGSLAGQAASHSADMVTDLKIGHLMSATPKGQFWAQLWGTVSTIVPMVGAFLVYTKAYPCIINHDESVKCPFELPAVMAWKAVAMAMTEIDNPIPRSSGISSSPYKPTRTDGRNHGNYSWNIGDQYFHLQVSVAPYVSRICSELGCGWDCFYRPLGQICLSDGLWCSICVPLKAL